MINYCLKVREYNTSSGYNVAVEYRYYVQKRLFVLGNFHAGSSNGSQRQVYNKRGEYYDFTLKNRAKEFMIGGGLGYDILQKGRHKIYAQASVGLGTSDEREDEIEVLLAGDKFIDSVREKYNNYVDYALATSLGYDYQLTRCLSIGANFTYYKIAYHWNHSYNLKATYFF